MWKLILVFAFEDPSWPENQPYPETRAEQVFQSAEACIAARDWWIDHEEAELPGMDARWYNLFAVCAPVTADKATI